MQGSVFILWHVHNLGGDDEDAKLIGVYETGKDAEAAIGRLSLKPGFSSEPNGFQIEEYEIGLDHWTEGYVTI